MKKLAIVVCILLIGGVTTFGVVKIVSANQPIKEMPETSFPADPSPVSQQQTTNNSHPVDCSSAGTINPYNMPAFGTPTPQENQQMMCQDLNSLSQTIQSEPKAQ